jgi:DNA-binding GntR family transcriptional regulator
MASMQGFAHIVDNRQRMYDLAQPTTIDRLSTAKRVAAHLRAQIARGKIEPGQRLNELALAGELGVSRSPIREALALLAGEGLVSVVPYKGTFVTALTKERLQDLLDFRLALEQFAVGRAIERAKPNDLDHFETLIDAIATQAKHGNFSGAVDADLNAHEYLIELAGSSHLAQTYKAMLGELRLYIAQTSRHYDRPDELAAEHAALLVAMRSRNVDKAMSLIAAHITHGFSRALEETK